MLFSLFPSRTIALALTLLPILSRAFDFSKSDEWIFNKLPNSVKEKGTISELQEVFQAGKDFIHACWEFFHK